MKEDDNNSEIEEREDRFVWAHKDVDGKTISTRYTVHTTMNKEQPVNRASFGVLKKIAQGAYGTVYLVKKRDDEKLFALKEISM